MPPPVTGVRDGAGRKRRRSSASSGQRAAPPSPPKQVKRKKAQVGLLAASAKKKTPKSRGGAGNNLGRNNVDDYGESSSSSSDDDSSDSDDSSEGDEKEKDMSLSLCDALLSLVPCTRQYREANSAVSALDDIVAMQGEVHRVNEIMHLIEDGMHDSALEEMMEDTEMSYSMFNRIKSGMHTAGEWKWKPPKRAMRAGSSYEAEEGDSKLEALTAWRRVKQLLRSSATDARNARKKGGGSAKALQAEQIRSAGLSDDRKARQSNSCAWKEEDEGGVEHYCVSDKFVHPTKLVKDEYGAMVKEVSKFCNYHQRVCVNDHGGKQVKIKSPNDQGLCTQCYIMKFKREPRALPKFSTPGVHRVNINALKQMAALGEKGSNDKANEVRTEKSLCNFVPNRREIRERGFECGNCVFRNPETRALHPCCGWHMSACAMTHMPDNDPAKKRIAVANQEGLCVAHYVARFGRPPPDPPWPFPGMALKHAQEKSKTGADDGTEKVAPQHPMAPREPPRPLTPPAMYKIVKKDAVDRFADFLVAAGTKSAQLIIGRFAARKIQKYYRRHHAGHESANRAREARARRRIVGITLIQAQARMFVAMRVYSRRKNEQKKSLMLLQRMVLGFVVRRKLRKKKAELDIMKYGMKMYNRLVQSGMRHVLGKRKETWAHDKSVQIIHRYMIGAASRRKTRRLREAKEKQRKCAVQIQDCWRYYAEKKVIAHEDAEAIEQHWAVVHLQQAYVSEDAAAAAATPPPARSNTCGTRAAATPSSAAASCTRAWPRRRAGS